MNAFTDMTSFPEHHASSYRESDCTRQLPFPSFVVVEGGFKMVPPMCTLESMCAFSMFCQQQQCTILKHGEKKDIDT